MQQEEQITIRYDYAYGKYRVNEHEDGDMVQIDEGEDLKPLKNKYPDATVLNNEYNE